MYISQTGVSGAKLPLTVYAGYVPLHNMKNIKNVPQASSELVHPYNDSHCKTSSALCKQMFLCGLS